MKVKISEKRKKLLYIVGVILVISFIFFNSLQDGVKSTGASDFVANILSAIFGNKVKNMTFLIRKFAHLIEYALLGVALVIAKERMKHKKISFETLLLTGLLCALVDETIQLFFAGRSGQVSDIWIDFCGFLSGLGVYFLIKWIKNKKIKK